jgi:acyl dehydratase
MAVYSVAHLFPEGRPGEWSPPLTIRYDIRDVLLYAVGVGASDLRFIYERHPAFAVFPTFPIRWSGAGLVADDSAIPRSPGPMTIDAQRRIEILRPLPVSGEVEVVSRLRAVHPKGQGAALVETESEVRLEGGVPAVRLVNSSYRRGVSEIGDIEPFQGAGESAFASFAMPADQRPDIEATITIPTDRANVYRLSGDYNPLHIDPDAARYGGFPGPIVHGLCTLGHIADTLLREVASSDARSFGSLQLRFASPVFPGDELCLRAWRIDDNCYLFDVGRQGRPVVSNGRFDLSSFS